MMPALGLIGIPGPRWLPPVPLPLFLLWPFAWICLGIARLADRGRSPEAAKFRTMLHVFCELRGLTIDVETSDHEQVRIRFL